jgi:FKBP-type peptidyl-prolyl cis-trans isomerase FklB
MKYINVDILRRTCGAWLIVAAAPLAGAQTSSAPSAPSAAPAANAPVAPSAAQSGYLFGLTFGEQLHNVGVSDQVALEDIERGLKDGLQGKKSTPADRQQVQEFVRAAMASAITHNQAAAKDFLARNGHEKGVMTTASGLEYKVIAAGDRKAPAIVPTDAVTVQYRGKLLDGTEFDSTYARGAPASFTVNGVIPGWQEALVLMKPGAKWQLFVPPELAYGARPQPGIPGGSLLIFDVELVSVKSNSAPAAPAKPAPKAH